MITNFYVKLVKKMYSLLEGLIFKKSSFFIKKNTLLILRLDSIGDYILFRNFIEVIKISEKYKNYKITLCGNFWWKDLAENLDINYIDKFIWVDYTKMNDFKYRFEIYKKIHSQNFEVLIHPSFSRDAISDGIVTHSGAKQKIGYNGDFVNLNKLQKDTNDKSYTHLIPSLSKYKFEFYRNLDFFEQLLSQKIPILKPEIKHTPSIENKIIICPGAKDAFRRWDPKKFAQLCDGLKAKFPLDEFTICGSEQDSILATEIIHNSNISFTDLTGKLNLIELIQIIAQAKLVITNDSGPFHIAVALGKKVICISNGNNYGRFSPYPKQMNTNSKTIYPFQLLAFTEADRLEKFCKEVKNIDINEIDPKQVFIEIKKYFFNT
jgi:ADP-heptose:LPS heptosyltransferase